MNPNVARSKISYSAEAGLILAFVVLASCYLLLTERGLSLVAFRILSFGCPLALILGLVGRRRGGEAKTVANLAIGLVVLTAFFACLLPRHDIAYEFAHRAQYTNSMKQVGQALNNYQQAYGRYPPAVVRDSRGRPLYSWRVLILPFMEETELYRQFHLDEPWDSPHNQTLLAKCPVPYRPIGVAAPEGGTFLQVFVGPGTAFESLEGERLEPGPQKESNFPDGKDRTILAIEASESVPWSAPYDLPYDPNGPISQPGGGYLRKRGMFSFGNTIQDFQILMADGSVQTEPLPLSEKSFQAKITRNGDEVVPAPFP